MIPVKLFGMCSFLKVVFLRLNSYKFNRHLNVLKTLVVERLSELDLKIKKLV